MKIGRKDILVWGVNGDGSLKVHFTPDGGWGITGKIDLDEDKVSFSGSITCWNDEQRQRCLRSFARVKNKRQVLIDALTEYLNVTLLEKRAAFDAEQEEQISAAANLITACAAKPYQKEV